MKVFLAGATGAIGQQLIPRLVAAGHEVHGMTRSESKQEMVRDLGAVPVVADALDPDQVAEAVGRASPDVIVHELTAISAVDMRHFDREFAVTNRLRTEGTDHLLAAGQAVGVRRFVAQSYFASYARIGGPVKSEDDPLDPAPAREMRQAMAAIRYLEHAVLDARWTEGIVLRYGGFYGPGTSMAPGGEQSELVRRRKFPLVGDGGGVWSFVHVADAADATVAAIDARQPRRLQRGRRRSGASRRVAPGARPRTRRQTADACAAIRRSAVRRRGGRRDDDRAAWRLQREGEARPGVGPGAPELEAGVDRRRFLIECRRAGLRDSCSSGWDGETAVIHRDQETGGWMFICIHSTRRGPAGGGTRLRTYDTPAAGLADAIRLSGAMTRKLAVAGLPFGGGKGVIAVPEIPGGTGAASCFCAMAS